MNRRTILKNQALVIGGVVLLPACADKDGASYVQLKHVNIDEDGRRLIAGMAETISPKTSTPGAKGLNLPAFVLLMKFLYDFTLELFIQINPKTAFLIV